MNSKLKIGVINRVKVARESPHGLYLTTEDSSEDVLLPKIYVTQNMSIGDIIDVFIYTDSDDRVVASTKKPKAILGEFDLFKVVDKSSFGVFVDWGLPKDLFVPKSIQKTPYKVGKSYILRVSYDPKTDRLFGDGRIGRYLKNDPRDLKKDIKDSVDILIIAKTPLGYKVVVNNLYEGMIFSNEIFENIDIGEHKKGYIKKIRDDGKLDISLQPIGVDKDIVSREKIIAALEKSSHILCNYKSSADEIKEIFGLSKKSFKKAVTKLQNDKIVTVCESGIRLIDNKRSTK